MTCFFCLESCWVSAGVLWYPVAGGDTSGYVEKDRMKIVSKGGLLTNFMQVSLYNEHEMGDEMYYELYVDSLFLVNFVMNLYLLLLTNRSLFYTATRTRVIFGAALGAGLYFLQFFCAGPIWWRTLAGFLPGTVVMILVTFRVRHIYAFLEIAEKMVLYAVLMGGTMLLLAKKVKWIAMRIAGIGGILGIGALLYLLFGYLCERRRRVEKLCRVTLNGKGSKLTVMALIDSGNSLVEPISGKPVCIVENGILAGLFDMENSLYRAIPYRSIGKRRGILKGYLMPEIQIECNGVMKVCRDVYVAVCEEYISEARDEGGCRVKMILHPDLLLQKKSMFAS